MFFCGICSYQGEDLISLNKHFYSHRDKRNSVFLCQIVGCGQQFSGHKNYRLHFYRVHSDNKIHSSEYKCDNFKYCKNCDYSCVDLKKLYSHISDHFKNGETVKCPIENCTVTQFNNANSFRSHVFRRHSSTSHHQVLETTNISVDAVSVEGFHQQDLANVPSTSTNSITPNKFSNLFHKLHLVHHVSDSALQFLSSELIHILESTQSTTDLSSDLNLLDSKYKRDKAIKSLNSYVGPNKIILGVNRFHKECHFHYVSILETLKVLLTDSNFMKAFKESKNIESHANYITDYHNGSIYKNNLLFSQNNCLELIIFQDAFEVCNPLGSAKKKHKLVGFYYMVGNLPVKYRSGIENIQLIQLVNEGYIKEFGIQNILAPLIAELKQLETEGITVGDENYRGSIFAMVGDNLGSHQIGGYVENFSTSKYFCRYCLYTRNALTEFDYTLQERRTIINYDQHVSEKLLLAGDQNVKGVQSNSILNDLNYYHVCLGLPPCIYHDLFEGIIPHDMMAIFKFFHNNNIISFDQINLSMAHFRKKFHLKLSFPKIEIKSKKIPGKADEILHFLILTPYVLINYIKDYDSPVWNFFSSMIEICRLILSPKCSPNQISQLSHYIKLYFEFRKQSFPNLKLRPKHHYICHYPELIRKFGPLKNLGTMRFEHKHQYFKNIMRRFKNFKNITFSLANYHQNFQATLFEDRFRFHIVSDDVMEFSRDIYNVNLPLEFSFMSSKIVYFNTMYKENDNIVIKSMENGNIIILSIKVIFVDKHYKNAIFYGKTIELWYNYKTLLYQSIQNNNYNLYSLCDIKSILTPHPVQLLKQQNNYYLSNFTCFD